jgi:hypothetical protein
VSGTYVAGILSSIYTVAFFVLAIFAISKMNGKIRSGTY